ncbi:hypothetical protein DE146DRAFT_620093 [Phaeosphaeria sp. MPI-PUGE-AT-0046c]|nr:hypothetical protein DE146DRAFT_620093 [Phaeosphaeria sp. MPI-PUGE-AT-0046c]
MSTRPAHMRTASTNLGSNSSQRPLEGRVGIVTGASRGKRTLYCHECTNFDLADRN